MDSTEKYFSSKVNSKDYKSRYFYNLRSGIMKLAKEIKMILIKQTELINKKIRDTLSDQFRKIRNYMNSTDKLINN